MPIVSASNGIRPEIRALAVIKLNKPVTPKEINDCVGTGDYAAKYISFLNTRYGFTIEAQKNGRTVVSYTCIAEPANVADLRAMKPKVKGTKVAKATKPAKTASLMTPAEIKAKNLETMRKVTAKNEAVKAAAKKVKVDVVEKTLGSTGEIAFSIDAGFDSMDNVNVKDFLR
jgi:hypothetical protein